jgi:hypothetical protein
VGSQLVYQSSINALRELLKSEDKSSYYPSASSTRCHITKRPRELSFTKGGEEYCFVQVTCDNDNHHGGIQYGIQAFGDEAIELYEEAVINQISLSCQ